MAASSSSAPSFSCSYDVFLSFRGKDTRTTFTDHLYTALTQAGIHTFRDDDEIERGEDIKQELDKAIGQSKVALVVFSPDYASSRWCLDELVQINQRRKDGLCYILPIFYHVDPSDVRWQKRSFDMAFSKHEEQYKEQLGMVQQWKDVLKEIADLGGKVLNEGQYEASFIKEIVKLVLMKLDRKLLYEKRYLIGIDSYVNKINKWLEDEYTDVRILIVHGIGGIGKTTIAKTVYNKSSDKFEKCSFLQNVRETSKQPKGVHSLQEQILDEMDRSQKINNTDQGVIKINEATCGRKVLIVFDDLDNSEQLEQIIGHPECLPLRSKIIVTTRNISLLNCHESVWKLNIQPLCHGDSFQLFNLHAFKGNSPPSHLFDYSKRAVEYCGGLPLALTVLASFLCRLERIDLWESAIKEMQSVPMGEVQKILKLSFDSLENDYKQLFLHIACFLIGMDKDEVVTILNGCRFQTLIGIQHLIDRCLVTNEWNQLTMHQLIRDMGRETVRLESDEPGERSRVWNHQEAFDVLSEGTGTKKIKGLTLNLYMLPPCDSIPIEAEAFKEMRNLQLLQLNNVRHVGNIVNFPKNLVWLCWHGFPFEYISATSYIKKLVVLDMRYSSLHHLFQESVPLPLLKILNLSNSYHLSTTPDFKVVPNLERLVLKNCTKLAKIDESIGFLKRLVLLNLNGCIKLKTLPRTIGNLKALQELYLAGCTELNKHSDLGLVRRGGTKLNQFSLAFLPSSLTKLNLSYCNLSDDAFLGNLSLPFLKILDLKANIFRTLPDDAFKGFPSLIDLDLRACGNLIAVPEVPDGLEYLLVTNCHSITKLLDITDFDGFSFDDIEEEDMDMIHSLKLFDKYIMRNVQLEMDSFAANMWLTSPVKALREHGIFSFFHPGSEIPNRYKYQKEGSSISFVLEDDIIYALNICIVYAPKNGLDFPNLIVTYRGTSLSYEPSFFPYGVLSGGERRAKPGKDMLWLSCWNFYNVLIAGDEVEVSVDNSSIEVRRIGVHPVTVMQKEWNDCLPTLCSLLPPPLSQNRTVKKGSFKSTRSLALHCMDALVVSKLGSEL